MSNQAVEKEARQDEVTLTLADWVRKSSPIMRPDVLWSSVIINVLALGLPLVTLQVYDRVIPNAAYETFSTLLFAFAGVLVIDVILKLARASRTGFLGARYEHLTATDAFGRLLNSKLETVEAEPAGTHLDRISGIDVLRDFYSGPLALSIIDLPFAVVFLALVTFIGGALVVVPIIILGLAIIAALWLGHGLREAIGDRKGWDDRRYNFIIETLGGIHTVKAMAMEHLMERRYERLLKSSGEAGHRVILFSAISQSLSGFFGQFTIASVAAFGVIMIINGQLTIGELAACTLLAGRSIQPVLRVLASWSRFQSILVAEKKLDALNAIPQEAQSGSAAEPLERLELKSASFRYADHLPEIIHGANLSVAVGEMVGIRGDNGAGKTTLLHMLTGRLMPTDGAFEVNGKPGDEVDRQHLRDRIAYLSQRPLLMQGTVLENMTLFTPDRYLEPAVDFAARLGLDEVFARMPDGYDTHVGDAGSSILPKGVAQRIALVRAMMRGPKFLLFDETNNSLDGPGEEQFLKTLEAIRSEVGIVIVTYRPPFLNLADKQLRLSAGTLTPCDPSQTSNSVAGSTSGQGQVLS